MSVPEPLPVPTVPIGGALLGECGAITPPGAGALPDDIAAASWAIADLDTGEVLAAKDPHARHRPASTIKVLLGLVAISELDLRTVITGTLDDANIEGSRAGVGPGGAYSNRQLLQGLLWLRAMTLRMLSPPNSAESMRLWR